jgi:hypothetical protein
VQRSTYRAGWIVVRAQGEIGTLNHHTYIGTEHILHGLIRDGDGGAARGLVLADADHNRVRQRVIQLPSADESMGPVSAAPAAASEVAP